MPEILISCPPKSISKSISPPLVPEALPHFGSEWIATVLRVLNTQ